MTRNDVLLAMLACAAGRPYSPVQIQKAMFLVTENLPELVDGPDFIFEAYDYGPFDASVYNEAKALQREGLASIAPSNSGRWNTYAATDEGVELGEQVLSEMDEEDSEYFRNVSKWVRSQSFSGLVKSIYEAYPRMKENSIFRG